MGIANSYKMSNVPYWVSWALASTLAWGIFQFNWKEMPHVFSNWTGLGWGAQPLGCKLKKYAIS